MKLKHTQLIYILICIKCILSIFFVVDYGKNGFEPKYSLVKYVSPDEISTADIAYNYNNGRGFSKSANSPRWGRPEIKEDIIYYPTSYRPWLPVLIHVAYQKIYSVFSPLSDHDIWHNHHSHYYTLYAFILFYSALFCFILSIRHFRYLSRSIFENERWVNAATVLYILMPSTLIYVGLTTIYENLVTPIVVMIMALVIKVYKRESAARTPWIIASLTTLAFLLRPQLTPVLAGVFAIFSIYVLLKHRYRHAYTTVFATLLFAILANSFILFMNYRVWGEITYSTRGDAFLWGHNPLARGSWDGSFDKPGSSGFLYQISEIPNLESLNELEVSKQHKKLAWEWIRTHPKEELMLIARKTAMYFMPYNYEKISFNLFTFLMNVFYLLSLGVLVVNVVKRRTVPFEVILLASLTLFVYVLNVMYFVEYRFKAFADPFILILAIFFIKNISYSYKSRQKRMRLLLSNKPE